LVAKVSSMASNHQRTERTDAKTEWIASVEMPFRVKPARSYTQAMALRWTSRATADIARFAPWRRAKVAAVLASALALGACSSSAIAKSVHAVVSSVTDITTTTATVRYRLYLGKSVALPNETGQAVYQGGQWKVSDASFCVLLGLEQVASPACPRS
jgi:hypothetical protein